VATFPHKLWRDDIVHLLKVPSGHRDCQIDGATHDPFWGVTNTGKEDVQGALQYHHSGVADARVAQGADRPKPTYPIVGTQDLIGVGQRIPLVLPYKTPKIRGTKKFGQCPEAKPVVRHGNAGHLLTPRGQPVVTEANLVLVRNHMNIGRCHMGVSEVLLIFLR